jgi:hypothetical protein
LLPIQPTADIPKLYDDLEPAYDLAAHSSGEEESFWSSGGRNLVLGTLAAIGGIVGVLATAPLLATAGGIALALAATGVLASGLGAAGGFVAATVGGIQLLTSGSRTAAQNQEINRAVDLAQNMASIGGMSGGLAAAATGADERTMENYVGIGAAAEGVIGLGQGAFALARGGYRAVRGAYGMYRNWRAARVAGQQHINQMADLAGNAERLGALPQGFDDLLDPNLLYPGHAELAERSHYVQFERELSRLSEASGVPITVSYGPARGAVVDSFNFSGPLSGTFERSPSIRITFPDREILPGVRAITPGTLTDEFMHVWNKLSGPGNYLPSEAASLHRFLTERVRTLGDTERLGQSLNAAYHKLEMLNYLLSRRGQGLPSFVIAAGRVRGASGVAGARLQQWAETYGRNVQQSGFSLNFIP